MDSTVIVAIVTGLTAIICAYIAYLTQRIHKAVNSERTAMIAEVRRLNELATEIAKHATLAMGDHGHTP